MRVPLRRILDPIGVRHVRASVQEVDVDRRQVVAVNDDGARLRTTFRRLVVAAGSRLVRSAGLPGAGHLHDVDTLPAAVALDEHLRRLPSRPVAEGRYTAVVIGAGFVGLELATELVTRLQLIAAPHGAIDEVRVVLVERAPVVGPELGHGPRRTIEDALDELGVERRLDELGRLVVDRHMRVVGVGPVFAAGDAAALEIAVGHRALQACQYAHQMGKHAGRNAASDVLGLPLVEFEPDLCDVPGPRSRGRGLHRGVRTDGSRDRELGEEHQAQDQPRPDLSAARRCRRDPAQGRPPRRALPYRGGRGVTDQPSRGSM
jgi:NADH dehydrogenase